MTSFLLTRSRSISTSLEGSVGQTKVRGKQQSRRRKRKRSIFPWEGNELLSPGGGQSSGTGKVVLKIGRPCQFSSVQSFLMSLRSSTTNCKDPLGLLRLPVRAMTSNRAGCGWWNSTNIGLWSIETPRVILGQREGSLKRRG